MNRFSVIFGLLFIGGLAGCSAGAGAHTHCGCGNHSDTKARATSSLSDLKPLIGHWEGVKKDPRGDERVSVDYQYTSGGSAVLERLFPGTPHEMVSVYHQEGDKLAMTHYCMLGNQPNMVLSSVQGNRYQFDFAGVTNLASPNDMHMHSLTMMIDPAGKLREEWTLFDQGKAKETTVLDLVKSNRSQN